MASILLVEDSATQAYMATKILERNGHTVIRAENGKQGIQLAAEHSPDLIIMDIVMPDANGFQATRAINKNRDTAEIPIIMLSSKTETTDKLWALRQGAMSYLTKPVREKELIDTIDNLLTAVAAASAPAPEKKRGGLFQAFFS